MTDRREDEFIDPRTIHPFWYALAIAVSVVCIVLFYVMQTTGFSDQSNSFSIDQSDSLETPAEG